MVLNRRSHVGTESFAEGPLVDGGVGQVWRVDGGVKRLEEGRNDEGFNYEPAATKGGFSIDSKGAREANSPSEVDSLDEMRRVVPCARVSVVAHGSKRKELTIFAERRSVALSLRRVVEGDRVPESTCDEIISLVLARIRAGINAPNELL